MSQALRILLIDDDQSIREFVSVALSDEGYEVVSAAHGAEALAAMDHTQPDLILLDMRMPVVDGWEFARLYRQTPGPHAPIVVLTAGRNAGSAAAEIAADAYLAKPFELAALLELVARYGNSARQPDSP